MYVCNYAITGIVVHGKVSSSSDGCACWYMAVNNR